MINSLGTYARMSKTLKTYWHFVIKQHTNSNVNGILNAYMLRIIPKATLINL